MAYHDLYIKWKSDKADNIKISKIQEILYESEYQELVLNYSIRQRPFPNLPENPMAKTRLTVKSSFSQLLNDTESLAKYDLIAARPQNDADFHYCCMTGEIDIISLKLQDRFQFKLKLNLVQEAIKRGIMFEICYALGLKDMNARRVFISNACNLVKATKGRNIVISSGAKDLFDQRAPWDVVNLACVLGMNIDIAHNCIVTNAATALEHGKARKVFKSAVQVVDKTEFLAGNYPGVIPEPLRFS